MLGSTSAAPWWGSEFRGRPPTRPPDGRPARLTRRRQGPADSCPVLTGGTVRDPCAAQTHDGGPCRFSRDGSEVAVWQMEGVVETPCEVRVGKMLIIVIFVGVIKRVQML